jgi:multidrug efflux pump subunit AcrA (membrane-fusion protein)
MPKTKTRKLLWIVPSAVAGILFLVFPQWPYIVKTPCYFSAYEEWELVHTDPDKLMSVLRQNAWQKIPEFTLFQFDRPDFLQFVLDPSLKSGQMVDVDQPLVELISSENRILLADLSGALKKARANLQLLRTGQKATVQQEAEAALQYAVTQHEAYLPLFRRAESLHMQNLISTEEWELTRTTESLYRRNVELQKAHIQVVKTGEKEEAIRMVEAEVESLEGQLGNLEEKMSLGKIRTPIPGMLSTSVQDSVFCRVSRLDSIVCMLPVRSTQIPFVRPGQRVSFRNRETGARGEGRVLAVDSKATFAGGRSVFLVSASAVNPGGRLRPGMLGFAFVVTDRASLAERFRRAWVGRGMHLF